MRTLKAGTESEWVECGVSREGEEGAAKACRAIGTENTDSPNGSQGLMINWATPISTSWVPGTCGPPTGDIAAYKDILFKVYSVPWRMVCHPCKVLPLSWCFSSTFNGLFQCFIRLIASGCYGL